MLLTRLRSSFQYRGRRGEVNSEDRYLHLAACRHYTHLPLVLFRHYVCVCVCVCTYFYLAAVYLGVEMPRDRLPRFRISLVWREDLVETTK